MTTSEYTPEERVRIQVASGSSQAVHHHVRRWAVSFIDIESRTWEIASGTLVGVADRVFVATAAHCIPNILTLGKATTVTAGGTPSREVDHYWNGDVPWVKTGELVDSDINGADEFITEAGLANSSAKLFPVDTILIALYGQGQTRGRTGRLVIEAATNQACCAILPCDRLEPRYTQYWLRSLYYEMREQSHGGAQPNWNGKMIKQIKIALPSLAEQRRIVAYLDGLQKKVDYLKTLQKKTATELDALLPSILDKAFEGEL